MLSSPFQSDLHHRHCLQDHHYHLLQDHHYHLQESLTKIKMIKTLDSQEIFATQTIGTKSSKNVSAKLVSTFITFDYFQFTMRAILGSKCARTLPHPVHQCLHGLHPQKVTMIYNDNYDDNYNQCLHGLHPQLRRWQWLFHFGGRRIPFPHQHHCRQIPQPPEIKKVKDWFGFIFSKCKNTTTISPSVVTNIMYIIKLNFLRSTEEVLTNKDNYNTISCLKFKHKHCACSAWKKSWPMRTLSVLDGFS